MNRPPNILKLWVFGCHSYPWLRPYSTHKLNHPSTSCVFVGYSLTQSAYLFLDPSFNKLLTSCYVEFVEIEFLFATSPTTPSSSTSSPIHNETTTFRCELAALFAISTHPNDLLHLRRQLIHHNNPWLQDSKTTFSSPTCAIALLLLFLVMLNTLLYLKLFLTLISSKPIAQLSNWLLFAWFSGLRYLIVGLFCILMSTMYSYRVTCLKRCIYLNHMGSVTVIFLPMCAS